MKNVLIPTDFSYASLGLIARAASTIKGRFNIILFHAFQMPDSLIDIVSRHSINHHGDYITEGLRIRCKKLKATYPNIGNISFRIMYGSTLAAFEHYAEANDIDLIIWPDELEFATVNRDSVDPSRMFRRSGIEILKKLESKKAATVNNAYPAFQGELAERTGS
jgi:hypothetical protein